MGNLLQLIRRPLNWELHDRSVRQREDVSPLVDKRERTSAVPSDVAFLEVQRQAIFSHVMQNESEWDVEEDNGGVQFYHGSIRHGDLHQHRLCAGADPLPVRERFEIVVDLRVCFENG